jgi:hypothetical protein
VHAVNNVTDPGAQEIVEQVKWLVRAINEGIAIGDDVVVALAPQCVTWDTAALSGVCFAAPECVNYGLRKRLGVMLRIN